jgi:hypothetical protein
MKILAYRKNLIFKFNSDVRQKSALTIKFSQNGKIIVFSSIQNYIVKSSKEATNHFKY